jgi:carboxynorspermidine decarboxylase
MISINYAEIPSPCYVVEEIRLRKNLELIRSVKERSGVEIILAFQAFALWKLFPIFKEYITCSTASSLSEAQLAFEEMGNAAHTYAPAYTDREFPEIAQYSSHITFNSLQQFHHFQSVIQNSTKPISCGLRINPEFSEVETGLYNPCAPGSRLGVTADSLDDSFGDSLPKGIEGLHFHTLCESSASDLEKTLQVVERKFGKYFNQIKWLNMGGGHLMTREGYDIEHLVALLRSFQSRYSWLRLILEPGSAFVWQTGELVSTIIDIVENDGIKTAILDISFACHAPDCLEMPYKPAILNAMDETPGKPTYRMGGNSCLAGDFCGNWSFEKELQTGDRIVFLDMIHYTTVKTTLFNGVSHPAIALWDKQGQLKMLRSYGYEDYKNRMC